MVQMTFSRILGGNNHFRAKDLDPLPIFSRYVDKNVALIECEYENKVLFKYTCSLSLTISTDSIRRITVTMLSYSLVKFYLVYITGRLNVLKIFGF